MLAIRDGLLRLGVSFDFFGVNLIDPRISPPTVKALGVTR